MDISVIIPVRNAAGIIGSQLRALSEQNFAGSWDIVICDNGSTDDMHGTVDQWRKHLPPVRILDASDLPGAGFARQVGLLGTDSARLAFCDADDIVSPNWLTAIYEGLDRYPIVAGAYATIPFDLPPEFEIERTFETGDFSDGPPRRHDVVFAGGNNSGYRREALPHGIALDYLVGMDGATSWRAAARGHRIGWAPEAKILFRQRPGGQKTFRRAMLAGVAGVKHNREFPRLFPKGSRFPWRTLAWLVVKLPLLRRQAGRRRWRYRLAAGLGTAIEILLPGLWEGLELRRYQRGDRSGIAAELPARGISRKNSTSKPLSFRVDSDERDCQEPVDRQESHGTRRSL